MTTLIELVNRVLLDVGERQVTTIATPASRKAKAYIQDAFNDIQMFHNWEWLNVFQGVDSLINEKATYTNIRRIRAVYWNNGTTYIEVPWIPYSSFIKREITSFDSGLTTNQPCVYTQEDEDTISVNPYPTDVAGRDKIRLEGIKYIEPPELETDVLQIPERFENILIKRAVYNMLIRHLGEPDMANAMNFEFTDILQRFKDQENRTPMKGTNMYAGRRVTRW